MAGTIILKTGRTRNLEIGGTISGRWAGQACVGVITDPLPDYQASGILQLEPPTGGSVSVQRRWEAVGPDPPTPAYEYWEAGLILSAAFPDTTPPNKGTIYAPGWNPGTIFQDTCDSFTLDWSATATFSVPMEELVHITWQDTNGLESPGRTHVMFYERLRQGELGTASISCAGTTVSMSGTVGNPILASVDDPQQYNLDTLHAFDYNTINCAGTVSMITHWGATQLTAPFSDSVTAGGNTSSMSTTNGCTGETSGSNTGKVFFNALLSPPRSFALEAIARWPTGAYPGTLGMGFDKCSTGTTTTSRGTINAVDGRVTSQGTHYDYSIGALNLANTSRPGTSVAEWAAMKVVARAGSAGDGDTYSLLSIGEDVRDVRALFRAWPAFDAFTLQQAGTTVVDAGTSLTPAGTPYHGTWSGVSNGTVTLDAGGSGSIRWHGTADTGVLKRTFETGDWYDGAPFNGYRYLDILCKTEGGTPQGFGVTIFASYDVLGITGRQKSWSADWQGSPIIAGTALGTVRIDLCSPGNETDNIDRRDTRWPDEWSTGTADMPPGFPGTVYGDGPYWGVTMAGSIVFTDLTGSADYLFDALELRRNSFSQLDMQPGFDDWSIQYDQGTALDLPDPRYIILRRHMVGETDGKRSLEIPDFRSRTNSNPYAGTSISHSAANLFEYDIEDNYNYMATALPHHGWAGSLLAGTVQPTEGTAGPFGTVSDWLNRYRHAAWIRAAGMMMEGTAWTYTDQLDVSSTVTLKAQLLCDRINWHPDIGNICEQGSSAAYGGSITLRAAYMARGGIVGLTLAIEGTPVQQIVNTTDTTQGVAAGSATADSQGWYRTGTPFHRGTHAVTGTAGGVTGTAVAYTNNRKRWRVVWKPGGDSWIAYDVSAAARHLRAFIRSTKIWIGYASNYDHTNFTDRNTGTVGVRPCIRHMDPGGGAGAALPQRAYMTYEPGTAGGTVNLAYTPNEGGSLIPVATLFSSGKWSRIHITRDGRKLAYCVSGTAIKGIILDGQDTVIVPEFTAVASGVDDDAIDCHEFFTGQGGWRMKLVYRSGGTVLDKVSTDGVVFS